MWASVPVGFLAVCPHGRLLGLHCPQGVHSFSPNSLTNYPSYLITFGRQLVDPLNEKPYVFSHEDFNLLGRCLEMERLESLWILSYFYGTIDVKIKWEDDDLLKMQALKKGPSKKKAPEEKRRQYCNSTPGTWSLLLTPPCSSPYDSVCPPVDEAVGPQLRLESLVWSPRLSRWYVVPLRPNEIGD